MSVCKSQPDEDYLDVSKSIMRRLGFVDEDYEIKLPRMLLVAVWTLRMFMPESLMLAHFMETFMAHVRHCASVQVFFRWPRESHSGRLLFF